MISLMTGTGFIRSDDFERITGMVYTGATLIVPYNAKSNIMCVIECIQVDGCYAVHVDQQYHNGNQMVECQLVFGTQGTQVSSKTWDILQNI